MNSLIKKINGYIRNIVIISLSFFMCANVLYTDVFAYDDDFQDNYVLNKIEDNDLDYDDIAYELIDKREGNKRYFKMNDGSTISCVYDHTVAIQDDEIGFYYLSSRYYDSNIGRFITKDEIEYLGEGATTVSYDLYAYCLNNPVNRNDTEGNFSVEICVLISFAVGVIYSAIDDYKDDHKLNASIGSKTYLENIVLGVVAGYCFGNIGAIIYEAVPTLISFSSSSFTMGTAIGVSSSAATLTSSVTITCADIIGTGVAASVVIEMA